jgi:hypothetical protein
MVVRGGSTQREPPAMKGSVIVALPVPHILNDVAHELHSFANSKDHETKSVQAEE